jgi:hypothetical protein
METMFGNVLRLVALKRVGALLTGLAFAILLAGGGNAADLPRRTNAKEYKRFLMERREAVPASAEGAKSSSTSS